MSSLRTRERSYDDSSMRGGFGGHPAAPKSGRMGAVETGRRLTSSPDLEYRDNGGVDVVAGPAPATATLVGRGALLGFLRRCGGLRWGLGRMASRMAPGFREAGGAVLGYAVAPTVRENLGSECACLATRDETRRRRRAPAFAKFKHNDRSAIGSGGTLANVRAGLRASPGCSLTGPWAERVLPHHPGDVESQLRGNCHLPRRTRFEVPQWSPSWFPEGTMRKTTCLPCPLLSQPQPFSQRFVPGPYSLA